MTVKIIQVRNDFTEFPGGRYREDGTFSGEEFRDDLLIPALDSFDQVLVQLDGTAGYPSSFLEEAFGGLVRAGYSRATLAKKLEIKADDPHYVTYQRLAEKYISEAKMIAAA
jgi:hypothetical protein